MMVEVMNVNEKALASVTKSRAYKVHAGYTANG